MVNALTVCRVPDIHVDVINAPLAGALDDDVAREPLAFTKAPAYR